MIIAEENKKLYKNNINNRHLNLSKNYLKNIPKIF